MDAAVERAGGGTLRVLLIEDNVADADFVREELAEDRTARVAFTHVERLERGLELLGGCDVVLLDLSLPDAWKLEGLDRLRAAAPEVPVVVLTGATDERLGIQAVNHGAQDYLVKGQVTGPLLFRALRYAVERHDFLARAQLLVREQAARAAAEEAYADALLLAEVSTALSHVLDYEQTLLPSIRVLAPRFADACAWVIHLGRDHGEGELLVLQADADGVRAARRSAPGPLSNLRDVTRAAALDDVEPAMRDRLLAGLVALGIDPGGAEGSTLVAPLSTSRGPIGVSVYSRTRRRPCGAAGLVFAEEVARRVVSAVEGARLVEELRRERDEVNAALRAEVVERTRAEESVRSHERFLDSIIENIPDMIVVKDAADLRCLRFNRAGESILGLTSGDVVGRTDYDLLPHAEAEASTGRDRQVLSGRAVVDIPSETVQTRSRGARTLRIKKIPVFSPEGDARFLLSISEDITDREQMRQALVQRERLASLGLLSAGIAHEINNPLAVVCSNLYVLERDARALVTIIDAYDLAGDITRFAPEAGLLVGEIAARIDLPYLRANFGDKVKRTLEGARRIARIVETLSNLARTAPPELQDVDLPELADACLDTVRGHASRLGIGFEVTWDSERRVRCVPTLLSQVLINLLTNALHAVEAGHPTGGGHIGLAGRTTDTERVIEVTDDGCGIPPDALGKLFDPFFTTKPVGQGMGLGLSITHNIVASHGGRITVDSVAGQGTCFRVYLPLRPSMAPSA